MHPRALLLLFLVFLILPAAGAAILPVRSSDSMQSLNNVLDIRQDDSTLLRFTDVLADELAQDSNFVPATPQLLNAGYSRAAYWLRVSLSNSSGETLQRWLVINQPRLQDVSLFFIRDGKTHEVKTGAALRFTERPVQEEKQVLPLDLPAGQTQLYYIRIASETSIQIDATLWEPMTFRVAENRLTKPAFMLFGALAMVACSGIFLFLTLRQSAFLYQSLAVLFYLFFECGVGGYTLSYLWPNHPAWDLRAVGAAAPLVSVFELLYLRIVLDSQRIVPRIDILMRLMIIAECVVTAIVAIGDYRLGMRLGQLLLLACTLLSPAAALLAWRNGLHSARIILTAMSIWWGIVFIRVLLATGVLPYSTAIADLTPWGFLIATSLMLWAIADRITLLQDESKLIEQRHRTLLEEQVQSKTEALRRALAAADAANQTKGDFLLRVTHDLRAPLTSILSYTTLLASDSGASTPFTLKGIDSSARYLLSLLDDLIAAARNDVVNQELALDSVRIRAFIDGISDYARIVAQQQSNRVELKIGPLPAMAQIDAKRLRQILLNLLDNAAKFTKEGLITFESHCSSPDATTGETVRLYFCISDTGIGIPAEMHERIFEPFHQLSNSESPPGLGLGLAIVARWAKMMGGEIALTSAPGKGSRFAFEIECTITSGNEADSILERKAISPGMPRTQRVLIVDDDPVTLAILSNLIETAGLKPKAVMTGAEAIAAATRDEFQLVVTDQYMPEVSGWDVLLEISTKSTSAPPPPVVLISSGPPAPPRNWPKHLKFAAILGKPIQPHDISKLIEQIIELQATERNQLDGGTVPSLPFDRRPSSDRLEQLMKLAELGAVSDIIDWANEVASAEPETKQFVDKVKLSAKLADLHSIRSLIA